jgi:predicted AlkP superfamily pyrophosphatase or phosphodiesterase
MNLILRWFWTAMAGLVVLAGAGPAVAAKPTKPFPEVEHVVIVSMDGMRPDRLLLANMPTVRGLIAKGAYSFWARTTAVAITLPSHTSMLTGVTPRKHGVEWNKDLPLSEPIYPAFPTLFEMARRAGYSTAMAAGKSKFDTLNKPGTITHVRLPDKDEALNDNAVAAAEKMITEHRPEVMFIHFPEVDKVGHKSGWDSAEQMASIERTDGHIRRILDALAAAGIAERTAIILTADHGGAGKGHGPDDPRSRHIPWILTGPHVKHRDLTGIVELEINTEDTCATACYLLGLSQLPYFDGKPVWAAFDKPPAP